ncbi:MAG: FAD-dependent oxidoreductase [Rhodobacteraceae bacterium]|nr:FAD-dependent oxidoreductase [Paracoccaceae bacterium]MCF8513656.1 FAD-dependent oxidoreductase [Paracoccaceae bacterium]
MTRPDLTIMGGGIFGLSCAWEAARRGAKVRVIEAAHLGAGASGGIVGALSPHVPESWNDKKAFQLDSLLMAEGFWGGVQAAGSLSTGYGRVGRLEPLADARAVDLAHARAAQAADLWQGRATWRVRATTGDAWEPHSPTGLLIEDTLSARLHPRMAVAALAAAIRAKGGEVIDHAGYTTPDDQTHGPVLWATGVPGLEALNAAFARTVGAGVKGQAILLAHDAATAPQLFADGLHIIGHADGTVAIGSTSEAAWDSPTAVDTQLDALHARAIAACPVLAGAPVLDRWAGLRPRAKSRAPLLGAWPGRAGHFVANGGFKIGFGMAPKVAQVMADLVLDGVETIPPGFGFAALR